MIPALQSACDAMPAAAEAVVQHMIGERVAHFRSHPTRLDTALRVPGLWMARGQTVIAFAEHLLEHGGRDFASPASQRDLKAAQLYGEWLVEQEACHG